MELAMVLQRRAVFCSLTAPCCCPAVGATIPEVGATGGYMKERGGDGEQPPSRGRAGDADRDEAPLLLPLLVLKEGQRGCQRFEEEAVAGEVSSSWGGTDSPL